MACEHAQHGGDDGRKRAEQAFRIEGFLIEMLFGYQGAVDDADQIVFEGERIGAVRYEPHGQPVADENGGRDTGQNGGLADAGEEQGGEHPGQTDAGQYTAVA